VVVEVEVMHLTQTRQEILVVLVEEVVMV